MLPKKSEKGQALVLIAFAAVGLFAFTALSVDGGRVFSDRRHAQNAADTAALAAALARVRAQAPSDPDAAAVTSGEARALTNGYPNDPASTVEVKICDDPSLDLTKDCQGLPVDAVLSDYVQVKITSYVRTTFARIIGWQQVKNVVTAVAKAQLGGLGPLFDGSAMVALSPNGSPTIRNQGNINLDIINSGIFDNSTDGCAFTIGGTSNVNVDTGYTIATNGTANPPCLNGIPQGNINDPSLHQSGSPIPYPPVFNPPIPVPNINCSGDGRVTPDAAPNHYTVHPGNFDSSNPLPNINNGYWTFVTGSYCIDGGISIGGNALVTANYVEIRIDSGEFSVTSNLNCNSMLVHINGGSGMTVNGNSHVVCHNVTFFASTGSVSLEGTGTQNIFTAPTDGAFPFEAYPEYKNLLVYMPYGNTDTLKITGNSGTEMTGSIIGVSAPVTLTGNNDFVLNSSITGFTIDIAGAATTTINYIPDDQITQLDPSSIGLTK
jgi:Flp pilus assembly protein TadG